MNQESPMNQDLCVYKTWQRTPKYTFKHKLRRIQVQRNIMSPSKCKVEDKSQGTMSPAPPADEVTMETREASPAHFLIKIESLSLLGQHGIQKYETGEFASGGYKWRLIIYPNGDNTGKDCDYISVYLALSDTSSLPANWEVNAVFSIFLFNQISCNYLCSLGRTRRFLAMKSEWGISKFISKKVLTDPSNGYLIDDNCVFGAEVFVIENSTVSECLSLKDVTIPYKRDWKIWKFSKLEDLWTSEEFSAGGHNWEILLYPNGWGDETGRCVSIFLNFLDSQRVKACFTIWIKNQVSKKQYYERTGCKWFSASFCTFGWPEFIELADINDTKKGFIVKDCCILEIEISVQASCCTSPLIY